MKVARSNVISAILHNTLTLGTNWESSIFMDKFVLRFKITHLEMNLWKITPSE